jgi:hypothetical protein
MATFNYLDRQEATIFFDEVRQKKYESNREYE